MTKKKISYGFATRAIHSGAAPEPVTGARNTPIYQTTSYVFKNTEHAERLFKLQDFGFIYSRLTNPTVAVLEERLASVEKGTAAVACSSGHAAQQLAFIPLLNNGDHFISSNKLYGGSINQFSKTFKNFGWSRPALLIGFFLSTKVELLSYQTQAVYGLSFLTRPVSIILIILLYSKIYLRKFDAYRL